MSRAYATAIGRPRDGEYQSISVSGTSAQTANAIADQVRFVALYATENCHIRFGKNPTATTSDFFLPRENLVMFPINPGEKIAAIQNSTAGTLHVSEMDH